MGQIKNIKLHIVTDIKRSHRSKLQHHGSCSNKDSEEGSEGCNREILHSSHARLPCEQTNMRGGGHHTKQEVEEQDRWLHHPSHEEDRVGTRQRDFCQTAGGGEREEGQLRARDICSRAGSHRGGHRHEGNVEDSGLHWIEFAGDATHHRPDCWIYQQELRVCVCVWLTRLCITSCFDKINQIPK